VSTAAPATPATPATPAAPTERVLRRGVLALAALGSAGTALELAALRHWTSPGRLGPWVALLGLAVGLLLVRWATSTRTIRAVQALAAGAVLIGALGVAVHVHANYEQAARNPQYSASWSSTSEPGRWLMAADGAIGSTPTLAPGAIAFMGLILLLGTAGLAGGREAAGREG
jgi:hypothetical protein